MKENKLYGYPIVEKDLGLDIKDGDIILGKLKGKKKMSKMVVELEWDGDDLGQMWMNMDNLAVLLFTDDSTKRELVRVTEISHSGYDQEHNERQKIATKYKEVSGSGGKTELVPDNEE